MINPQNNDVNNDVTIVGTDFFTDSESFLNELTDDELEQVRGGTLGLDCLLNPVLHLVTTVLCPCP